MFSPIAFLLWYISGPQSIFVGSPNAPSDSVSHGVRAANPHCPLNSSVSLLELSASGCECTLFVGKVWIEPSWILLFHSVLFFDKESFFKIDGTVIAPNQSRNHTPHQSSSSPYLKPETASGHSQYFPGPGVKPRTGEGENMWASHPGSTLRSNAPGREDGVMLPLCPDKKVPISRPPPTAGRRRGGGEKELNH